MSNKFRVALAFVLLNPVAAALATPIVQTRGTVTAEAITVQPGTPETVRNDAGFDYLNKPEANGASRASQYADTTNGGYAQGAVTAAPGLLKVWAEAAYPAYTTDYRVLGWAGSTALASFADTLLATGSGLALDTPVSYTLHYLIDGWIAQPDREIGGYLATEVVSDVRLSDLTSNTQTLKTGDSWRNDLNGWHSLTINTLVGHELLISAMLYATASVHSYATTGHFAEADYGNSAHFYLSASDARLNLTGASGHDYTQRGTNTDVPEPASAMLVLLGLLGLVALRQPASQISQKIQRLSITNRRVAG